MTKFKKLLILTFFGSLFSLVACNGGSSVDLITIKGESLVELDAAGSPKHIELYYTQDWNTQVDADWILVDPKQGYPKTPDYMDSLTVTIAAQHNKTGAYRDGSVTFSTKNGMLKLRVKQAPSY